MKFGIRPVMVRINRGQSRRKLTIQRYRRHLNRRMDRKLPPSKSPWAYGDRAIAGLPSEVTRTAGRRTPPTHRSGPAPRQHDSQQAISGGRLDITKTRPDDKMGGRHYSHAVASPADTPPSDSRSQVSDNPCEVLHSSTTSANDGCQAGQSPNNLAAAVTIKSS